MLLTIKHLPYEFLVSILDDPIHKDFNIYADEDIGHMIIKIGCGLSFSIVYCLFFIAAIICTLQEDRSNLPVDPSHVDHSYTDDQFQNANNNASDENVYDDLVVNLSQHPLTEAQTKILSRGLKFCPNPGEPDISLCQADIDKFHLRLKRFLHFHKPKRVNTELDDPIPNSRIPSQFDSFHLATDEPFKHQTFKNPSAWLPPPIAALEFFISKNKLDLAECQIPPSGRDNISRDERTAIKQLANNTQIVIKPADKGGAVVVQDREKYIVEGLRQLSDPKFYVEVKEDLSQKHHKEIVNILDEMLRDGEIDRSCYLYLSDDKIRTPEFYMLPKIHKDRVNPPGRPIVSGNGCPTERISKFIDFFLQPNVKNIASYIKDTTDFLLMLDNLGTLPPNCLLVTLDVSSLYTNIPNQEGRQATRISLDSTREGKTNPSTDKLIELLDKVLMCNNFGFNGRHFLQIGGTAMGTKVAPAYANTFMGWYEEEHVYTYHKQPLLWKRFIDDIFVIWQYDHEELQDFIQYLNSRMPSIKFEADISEHNVHFLDVDVFLNSSKNKIETTLYTKPTDSHNYINYRSCHQKLCNNGIPYGQFLRLKRICSDEDDYVAKSKLMAYHFHLANYPIELIQSSFERAYIQNRYDLLNAPEKIKDPDQDNLYLITTHHPTFRGVNEIVNKNKDLLHRSSSTRPILQANLVQGFRRCKNLRDILVKAKLRKNKVTNKPNANKCKRPFCIYCNKLDKSGSITSVITEKQYQTRYNVCCSSNNLTYALACKTCGKIYVGQTKRRLMYRLLNILEISDKILTYT